MAREVNLKGSALSWGAVDANVSITLFYDAVNRGESESGAFAPLFGGEERFKDMCERTGVHARASVCHYQEHIAADFRAWMVANISLVQVHVGGFDLQLAAHGHGIARVDGQIHDDLLDLALVCLYVAKLR